MAACNYEASSYVPLMTQTLIKSHTRGTSDLGWLKSNFSFSFADYYDPARMHFESLRVINDDWIAPAAGFPAHPHKDAEIFSYVLSGTIEHKDSMGNGSRVGAGGVQYMSAGSGVRHSEFNPDPHIPLEILQVWLLPNIGNAVPRYETLELTPQDKRGRLKLFLCEDGRDGAMKIRQDADIFAGLFDGAETALHTLKAGRRGYVHMARGSAVVNGARLSRGDAMTIDAGDLKIEQGENAELLLFDLAPLI